MGQYFWFLHRDARFLNKGKRAAGDFGFAKAPRDEKKP
jgi:hypothetical protein